MPLTLSDPTAKMGNRQNLVILNPCLSSPSYSSYTWKIKNLSKSSDLPALSNQLVAEPELEFRSESKFTF